MCLHFQPFSLYFLQKFNHLEALIAYSECIINTKKSTRNWTHYSVKAATKELAEFIHCLAKIFKQFSLERQLLFLEFMLIWFHIYSLISDVCSFLCVWAGGLHTQQSLGFISALCSGNTSGRRKRPDREYGIEPGSAQCKVGTQLAVLSSLLLCEFGT